MSPENNKKNLTAELALFMVAVIWGMNPPIIKVGLQYLPPQPYNLARMIVGAAIALIALAISGTYRPMNRADFWKIFRISAFGFFIFQLFFTEGIQRTTSGNASFMLCLMPVSVLLLNKFCGIEKITRPTVIGIFCSVCGITLIVLGAGKEISLASNHLMGTIFILLSQAGYAYYTVFSKELLERYSTYQITAYLMVITALLLLIASSPVITEVSWTSIPWSGWASVVFSGMIALCLCNFLWIWGLGIIGTSRAAIFNNLSPVFAIATGYYLLGETFGLLQAAGAAFVFLGVYITRNRNQFL